MTAIAIQHRDEILAQVSQGKRICDIAAAYGITQPAISRALLSDPEWLVARESGTLARIEAWETEVESINPETAPVMLARAREMLSHARWRAEREFPERWGAKGSTVNVQVNVAAADSLLAGSAVALLDEVLPRLGVDSGVTPAVSRVNTE